MSSVWCGTGLFVSSILMSPLKKTFVKKYHIQLKWYQGHYLSTNKLLDLSTLEDQRQTLDNNTAHKFHHNDNYHTSPRTSPHALIIFHR
mmetsp:Transcript_6985/g.13031  ORF Transcript_6985/g.13031 Transcript_6985/m.13031 type:complete len:89 (+) Transcript_6985:187-453(+)